MSELMRSDRGRSWQTSSQMQCKPLIYDFDMLFRGGGTKGAEGKFRSQLFELAFLVFAHADGVLRGNANVDLHFPCFIFLSISASPRAATCPNCRMRADAGAMSTGSNK